MNMNKEQLKYILKILSIFLIIVIFVAACLLFDIWTVVHVIMLLSTVVIGIAVVLLFIYCMFMIFFNYIFMTFFNIYFTYKALGVFSKDKYKTYKFFMKHPYTTRALDIEDELVKFYSGLSKKEKRLFEFLYESPSECIKAISR